MLLRDYFNSFMLNKRQTTKEQIGRTGVQVKTEQEKFTVLCSRFPQDLEFGHFTLLFAEDVREMYQNFKKKPALAERLFWLIKPFVLWRCGCRRRRVFVRSLFRKTTPWQKTLLSLHPSQLIMSVVSDNK